MERLDLIAQLCPIALALAPRPCLAGPPETRVQMVDALLAWLDAQPPEAHPAWIAILASIAKAEPGLQLPAVLERAAQFEALARGESIAKFESHPEALREASAAIAKRVKQGHDRLGWTKHGVSEAEAKRLAEAGREPPPAA